jgi:hypothetical protein
MLWAALNDVIEAINTLAAMTEDVIETKVPLRGRARGRDLTSERVGKRMFEERRLGLTIWNGAYTIVGGFVTMLQAARTRRESEGRWGPRGSMSLCDDLDDDPSSVGINIALGFPYAFALPQPLHYHPERASSRVCSSCVITYTPSLT